MTFNLGNSIDALKQANQKLSQVLDEETLNKYSRLVSQNPDKLVYDTLLSVNGAQDQVIAELHKADSISTDEIQELVVWLGFLIQEAMSPEIFPATEGDPALQEAASIISELNTGALSFDEIEAIETGENFDKLSDCLDWVGATACKIIEAGPDVEQRQTIAYITMHIVSNAIRKVLAAIEGKTEAATN